MSLGVASLHFLVQAGFGSLLTFVVNDRQALGPKYYKFAGWVLLGLYGLAGSLVWGPALADGASDLDRLLGLSVALAAAGCVLFASVSGWDRPGLESTLLWASLIAGGAAVALTAWRPGVIEATDLERGLVLASAYGSALVIGFTTWGMILGHWYLVSQGLDISHLARLVKPLPWLLLGKTLLSCAALWLMWDRVLGPDDRSLTDLMARSPGRVLDVASLWARIPVGLIVPTVMAFMALVTVRMEKTQPATGILYAMCATVYLGEGFGKIVEGSFGIPL